MVYTAVVYTVMVYTVMHTYSYGTFRYAHVQVCSSSPNQIEWPSDRSFLVTMMIIGAGSGATVVVSTVSSFNDPQTVATGAAVAPPHAPQLAAHSVVMYAADARAH